MLSFVILIEIFLFIVGIFTIFKKMSLSSTESYCYSVILALAIYSLTIQIFFLLHLQRFYYVVDISVFTFSLYQIWREKRCLPVAFKGFVQLYKQHKFILSLIISVWGYLFLQVLLLPPSNWDSMTYHLTRVLMFQDEGSLFLKNFIRHAQATYPWGYDILSFLFLRFYSDYGLPIFSFLSYTVIVLGTYGLVQKIFNKVSLSLITCFIIASLKGLILQATTTKNDIPCAALSIVCFLAGYNFYQSSKLIHFYILMVTFIYGLSVKSYFALFLLPFSFLYLLFLFKERPLKKFMSPFLSTKTAEKCLCILPLCLLVCLMLNLGNNLILCENIAGETKAHLTSHLNQYGLFGCSINIMRYLLQSLDPPFQGIREVLTNFHNTILGDHQFISTLYVRPFSMTWGNVLHEDRAWYGLIGFALIIPSILFSLLRGPGYFRVVSLSLLAFFFIVSYQIVWFTSSARYFSLFFGGSGLCVAFLLHRVSRHNSFKYIRLLIVSISALSLFYTALFNVKKPFPDLHSLAVLSKRIMAGDAHYLKERLSHPGFLIFNWLYYVKNRTAYYDTQFTTKELLNTFLRLEPGKRVLLIGQTESWVFPFLIQRPDLFITVARPDHIYWEEKIFNINVYDDFLFLKSKFDYLLFCEVQPGEAISSSLRKEKQLFYVRCSEFYPIPITLYELSRGT